MTKFEILYNLKKDNQLNRIRDIWKNSGEPAITPNTKIYTKNTIYHVRLNPLFTYDPTLPIPIEKQYIKNPALNNLDGALVFCENEIPANTQFNWNTTEIYDIDEGYIVNEHQIITPFFRLLLTNDELLSITEPYDPNYKPIDSSSNTDVKISDEELEIILSTVGVPFIEIEELEYSRDKICELFIKPAMQEYYKYFPIIKVETNYYTQVTAGQKIEIEMPPMAFGVVKAIITMGPTYGIGPSGNPLHFFLSEVSYQNGLLSGGVAGKRNSTIPGYSSPNFGIAGLSRAFKQGVINYLTRMQFRIDRRGQKRYFVGYANKSGYLEISWAYYNYDWSSIDFNRLNEVRSLAAANVIKGLVAIRSQATSETAKIDTSKLESRISELEENSIKLWKSRPNPIVIRGSF